MFAKSIKVLLTQGLTAVLTVCWMFWVPPCVCRCKGACSTWEPGPGRWGSGRWRSAAAGGTLWRWVL